MNDDMRDWREEGLEGEGGGGEVMERGRGTGGESYCHVVASICVYHTPV